MASAPIIEKEPQTPAAIDVSTLDFDLGLIEKAQQFVGRVVVGDLVTKEDVPSDDSASLQSATEKAREGDIEARKRLKASVSTDRFERRNKYGFTMPVDLDRLEDGTIIQFGQTIEQNTANSIQYVTSAKLRERAMGPEAINGVRLQEYADRGLLKDNYLITTSLVHQGMSEQEAKDAGFFMRYRSLAIQVITEVDGVLKVKTIFIAGKEGPEDEPFDDKAVRQFAKNLGVSYEGMDSEEILGRPILAPKEMLEHGSASVSMIFDRSIREVTQKHKFYGRDAQGIATIADYLRKEQQDLEAISSADEDVERIVDQLIAANTRTPLEATTKLAQLNEQDLKKAIVEDNSIDAHVLGDAVAWQIYHARHIRHNDPANLHQLELLQRHINKHGSSSSCPGGASIEDDEKVYDPFADQDENQSLEDCEFVSKECPKCGEKNVKTECKDGVYIGACGCRSDR